MSFGRLAIYFAASGITAALIVPYFMQELRGKDLVCFCPLDQPCHADVLLEIANEK